MFLGISIPKNGFAFRSIKSYSADFSLSDSTIAFKLKRIPIRPAPVCHWSFCTSRLATSPASTCKSSACTLVGTTQTWMQTCGRDWIALPAGMFTIFGRELIRFSIYCPWLCFQNAFCNGRVSTLPLWLLRLFLQDFNTSLKVLVFFDFWWHTFYSELHIQWPASPPFAFDTAVASALV